MNQSFQDTIIAISTPPGAGGIGIIRISGPEALQVAREIFSLKESSQQISPRRMHFGYLVDREAGETLDVGYLCYFPPAISYTREEVVEIYLHGSPVLLAEAVRMGIRAGARQANPGEFTLRAYLNGRLDIIQAEAINDLIRACSLDQAKISFRQMEGSLSKKIASLREKIVDLLVLLETALEFPEEELEVSGDQLREAVSAVITHLDNLIRSYERGRALMEGLTIAIVGRTNVGKSTLFNALLEEDRAIVAPFPGTTRDFIRENIQVDGVLMKLIDMAGFGQASHPVEEEGMARGQKLAEKADGLLVVLDASVMENQEDLEILDRFSGKKKILVFNKSDLPRAMDRERVIVKAPGTPFIEVSALTGYNIDRLRKFMLEVFGPKAEKQDEVILHERQKILLERAREILQKARMMLEEGFGEELIAETIRESLPLFGQLTGEIKSQEVLEQIFNTFCIGK